MIFCLICQFPYIVDITHTNSFKRRFVSYEHTQMKKIKYCSGAKEKNVLLTVTSTELRVFRDENKCQN